MKYFERLSPVSKEKSSETDEKSDDDSSQGEVYWVGDRRTWIDYVVFELLDSHVEFGKLTFKGTAKEIDVLESLPHLKVFYESFGSRPNLQRYLKAKHRYPLWRFD